MAGKADNGHTHDDRYYTKYEVNAGMAGKADNGHAHNAVAGYTFDLPTANITDSWLLVQKDMTIQHRDVSTLPFLPLTGGMVNGSVTFSAGNFAKFGTMSISCENNGYTFISNSKVAANEGLILALNSAGSEKALYPNVDKGMLLGASSRRWSTIYAGTSTISTSDRNVKKDISAIPDQYLQLFALLQPVTYRFIDGSSGRIHVGFVAQDVEAAMEQAGLTNLDFAGFCKDVTDDGDIIYSLRYEEFIALNTAVIQQQQQSIELLVERVDQLEQLMR